MLLNCFVFFFQLKKDRDIETEESVASFLRIIDIARSDKSTFKLPASCSVVVVCKKEQDFMALHELGYMLTNFVHFDKLEVHRFDNLEELKHQCLGCADEKEDTQVFFKCPVTKKTSYVRIKVPSGAFTVCGTKGGELCGAISFSLCVF